MTFLEGINPQQQREEAKGCRWASDTSQLAGESGRNMGADRAWLGGQEAGGEHKLGLGHSSEGRQYTWWTPERLALWKPKWHRLMGGRQRQAENRSIHRKNSSQFLQKTACCLPSSSTHTLYSMGHGPTGRRNLRLFFLKTAVSSPTKLSWCCLDVHDPSLSTLSFESKAHWLTSLAHIQNITFLTMTRQLRCVRKPSKYMTSM